MLTLVSCMCPNLDSFYQGLAARLSERLERDVRFVGDRAWGGRLEMLRTGGASLGSVCGLQYVNEVDSGRAGLVPLAAPAPAGERYGGRPVYFTEMLVAAGSGLSSFESLAGARWAYNEPTSHSGFGVVGY